MFLDIKEKPTLPNKQVNFFQNHEFIFILFIVHFYQEQLVYALFNPFVSNLFKIIMNDLFNYMFYFTKKFYEVSAYFVYLIRCLFSSLLLDYPIT